MTAVLTGGPPRADELAEPHGAVGDSLSVAVWTLVSRLSGMVRGVVVAGVLGATYFANAYQFTNALPNLVFYGFLAGSLFTSLLVPALVRDLDAGDLPAAARVAGGLFGTAVALTVAVVPVAVLLAPLALRTASAGGGGGGGGGGQARVAGLLVLMLMPQVPLYAMVGTATAVMNAQRRFALAAAAPALENVGTIAVLGLAAVLYPGAAHRQQVPIGLLLLLGLGTTGSVALHASVQWWGARRAGVRLRPRAGWRDPAVRRLLAQAGSAVVQAGLGAAQLVVLLALANQVAGGVVAFQLALNFYFLPIALAATPVALSLAPRLARMLAEAHAGLFRDTFVQGLVFALFLAVPAAVGYLSLAGPMAEAVSFGDFPAAGGPALVAAALGGLSVGVLAETVFLLSTYACYARGDTRTPLVAMMVQTAVCLGVATVGSALPGVAPLALLGLALSTGGASGAALLVVQVLRSCARGRVPLLRPALRTVLCAVAMVWPAQATADAVGRLPVPRGTPMLAAAAVGAGVYFAAQALARAPELAWVGAAIRSKLGRRTPAGALPHPPAGPVPRRRPRVTGPQVAALARDVAVLAICLGVGALTAVQPVLGVAAAVGLIGSAIVWQRPQLAAYLLIGVTPLVAGIDRGTVLPVFRPNEALLFGLCGVLGVRALVRARAGWHDTLRLNGIEQALLWFAAFNSIVPLIMMVARGRQVTGDDLNYALVLWKLVALYAVVRCTVRTPAQVMRCLWVSMASGAVVSVVAVLQALGLFGVPRLLAAFYSPFGVNSALAIGRGSSTLSLPAAVADLAIVNLLISLTLLVRRHRRRALLVGSAVVSVFGVVGAAEFSTFIGMVIALGAFVVVTGQRRVLGWAVPVGGFGAVVLEPVISTRLAGFSSASGLPVSWIGRLRNLQTYFWPPLRQDWNWVLGVRLQARVPSSAQEFGWIWIESGYTWLLWSGGLPLLLAYLALAGVAVRAARRLAGAACTPLAVVGVTVCCAMAADLFLMLFDPHITYRGAGDALFGLLALSRPMPTPLESARDSQIPPAPRPAAGRERADRP